MAAPKGTAMRFMHFLLATALTTLSIGTVACSGAPADDGSKTSASNLSSSSAVNLTKDDDGRTVKVDVGQDVVISLPQNGSTGYSWMIKTNDLGDPQRNDVGGDPSQPGSGGDVTFTFSTAGAGGLHTIELILQRPWAETTPPADHFSVTLDIEEPGRPSHLTCATVDCASGYHCEMKGINGGSVPACVADEASDCRTTGCADGKWCSRCWGPYVCIPKGAMC